MKLRLLSDTHLEVKGKYINIPPMSEDKNTVLVLAGDIGDVDSVVSLIEEIHSKFLAIVYVAGNHEYYSTTSDYTEIQAALEYSLATIDNVYFLDNSLAVIDGVTFIGGTLWSSSKEDKALKYLLNDFRLIKKISEDTGTLSAITQEDMSNWNKEAITYLTDTLNRLSGDIVVVTHFSPSHKSNHVKYKESSNLNNYFHNNLEEILENNKVTWLHGHTHASCAYAIGKSKVYCNPWGYYDIYIENPEYNPQLIIEV